jgi:serine/threonine-protein kinase
MTPVREGDLLAGKYRIERVLGVGGMGVVVAARHEQLGQLVAIKFVREDALANEDAIERFLREARSAVRLKSDHVARVIDVGKLDSGAPYMVMEYLEGDDLGKVLEDEGPLSPSAAVELVLQACEAVAEAHGAGIVHRDLKPQNLFLTHTVAGRPKLKVLDFGVSKSTGSTTAGQGVLTRTRSMLGSPLYMSPEQMRSAKDVDARADVWALGVVMFELLTRRWPFEAQNIPELCLKVVTEPPQSLAALRGDLHPDLVAVVERCLSKNPGERYADASQLALALEPFAAEAPRRPFSVALSRPRPSSVSNETMISLQTPARPAPGVSHAAPRAPFNPSETALAPAVSLAPSPAPALTPALAPSPVPTLAPAPLTPAQVALAAESRVTPSPSSLDSTSTSARQPSASPARTRALLGVAAVVVVAVAAVGFMFSRRSSSAVASQPPAVEPTQAAAPPSPLATHTASPSSEPAVATASAPTAVLTPLPAVTLAPTPALTLAPTPTPTPALTPAPTPTLAPKPLSHPPVPAHPVKTDDDIPALR